MRIFLILISLLITVQCDSQVLFEDDFSEGTISIEKFAIYLDSIDKYLYRDVVLTEKAFEEIERLFDGGLEVEDSLLFKYKINESLYLLNMRRPLESYKIYLDNTELFDNPELTAENRMYANYMEGFSLMELGDLEAAQAKYYENIKIAESIKDTISLIDNTYSMGIVYSDSGFIEDAIDQFKGLLDMNNEFNMRPSTFALINIELCEAFIKDGQYDEALDYLAEAISYAEAEGLNVLKINMILLKVGILIEKKELKAAKLLLTQCNQADKEVFDIQNQLQYSIHLSELYSADGRYKDAREIQMSLLASLDSTDLSQRQSVYEHLHNISSLAGDYQQSYKDLLNYNAVSQQILEDEKRQKTEYLKIKFHSEQTESQNKLLSAEVSQNRAHRKFFISLIGIFFLLSAFLGILFFQNKRFNTKLKHQVAARTVSLKKSNEELDEFNRILSHDLKEPIRNITSFSQLASKLKDNDVTKMREYLGIVEKSGIQLDELIEDVLAFRSTAEMVPTPPQVIDFPKLLDGIKDELDQKHHGKNLKLEYIGPQQMNGSRNILKSILFLIMDNGAKFNTNEEVELKISMTANSDNYVIDISDNGIGVESAYHLQIFNMFKRLTNRETYKGSGLGLPIAKRLGSIIGAEIRVHSSAADAGSCFRIELQKVQT